MSMARNAAATAMGSPARVASAKPSMRLTSGAVTTDDQRAGWGMTKLTKPQIEVLSLHRGTSRAVPRRNPMDGHYFRNFDFPSHPTAMALLKRGLLDYRGYDGKSRGGWFITDAGERRAEEWVAEQGGES